MTFTVHAVKALNEVLAKKHVKEEEKEHFIES